MRMRVEKRELAREFNLLSSPVKRERELRESFFFFCFFFDFIDTPLKGLFSDKNTYTYKLITIIIH